MESAAVEELWLDPAIRNWVLFPIMAVMILVGMIRHHVSSAMTSVPKQDAKAIREMQALQRARQLRSNGNYLPGEAFRSRKEYMCEQFANGAYLKNPNSNLGPSPADMMTMTDGLKKNMFALIPQSLIMGWVTFFFSGFVLLKLPFPLTLRFKAMLQRGVETADMDVSWVSSLSWYFLLLFGLRSIFIVLLGEENAADSMRDMQAMGGMAAPGQPVDMTKLFKSERENLEVHNHRWLLEEADQRLLKTAGGLGGRGRV